MTLDQSTNCCCQKKNKNGAKEQCDLATGGGENQIVSPILPPHAIAKVGNWSANQQN